VPLLSRVVAAALVGALLGLLDFFLFELQGNLAGFREYVLYKPSLFGLSLLSFQLLAFAALGILSFCLFSLAWLILGKLFRKRGTFPFLPLSSATLALGMIALRVYMNSGQAYGLSILALGSAVLVFWALVLERSHVRLESSFAARLFLSPRSQLFVVFLLIVASVFSPDVYSGILRLPHKTEDQHARAPNVLFIVLDAVRADHLSCYGYEKGTTPNIDRVSQEGVLFSNAFSAAPWTLPSHASMFTGLCPSQHQADWGHAYLDRGFPTLAERLRDIGYQTVGFSENVFVGRTFGLARGFDEFHETWRRPLVVRALARNATRVFGYRERLDCPERTIGLFERWVGNNRNRGKPFFAFFNFMSAHLPRYPRLTFGRQDWPKQSLARIEPVNLIPERFYVPKFRLNREDLAVMADVYDSDLSYLDSQIGDLMVFLTEAGIRDNTIVILTSDHGENFGEHGLIEHQFCLYDTLLHVPLVVRYPGFVKPARIETKVSTVSLFKTVLALVGASRSTARETARLDPLAGLQAQDFVVAECANAVGMLKGTLGSEGHGLDFSYFDRSLKCIIKGGYKFTWSSDGRNELYQIEEDPSELDNLIEKEPDQARVLSQLLTSWERSTPKRVLF